VKFLFIRYKVCVRVCVCERVCMCGCVWLYVLMGELEWLKGVIQQVQSVSV